MSRRVTNSATLASRRPLRVLHVVHTLGDGGVDRALTRLVNASDPSRVAHSIWVLHRGSGYERLAPHVHVLTMDGHRTSRQLERFLASAGQEVDIVHGWVARASVLAAAVASALARPLVLLQPTNMGMELRSEPHDARTYWPELHRAYGIADAVVVPSPALVRDTQEVCGVARPVVIPFSVDVDRVPAWRPSPIEGRPFVAGLVCRLCRQKDPLTLVHAVAIANRQRPVALHIWGDGYLRPAIETRARELGLERLVTFHGFDPDWLQRVDAMDAFVFPTLFEGLSNGVLEAAAAGVPIVTTDIPENRAALRHGVDSLLVPPRSAEALAAAILRVAEDRQAAIHRGRVARARVRRFSLARMVASYERLYLRLARPSRAAREAA